MIQYSRIAFSLLLAAVHALVVPVHVAWAHGPDPHLAGASASDLHVHGTEDDHHEEHAAPSAPAHAGTLEIFDASDYGVPHRHDAHAHSETDHGFARARADAPILYPPALAQDLDIQVHALASQTVRISEAPPPRAPTLPHPSLRGPPAG